jgi:hypothetical protein
LNSPSEWGFDRAGNKSERHGSANYGGKGRIPENLAVRERKDGAGNSSKGGSEKNDQRKARTIPASHRFEI